MYLIYLKIIISRLIYVHLEFMFNYVIEDWKTSDLKLLKIILNNVYKFEHRVILKNYQKKKTKFQ